MSEPRLRRLERLALANGAGAVAALAVALAPWSPPLPVVAAALGAMLACALNAVRLRRRFWAAFDGELRRRREEKQEARAAEILKDRFLADVSHEIRTPMNGILGMTGLLLKDGLSPLQHERVDLVRTSAEALLALVGDILDLSRIEAGRLRLRPRDFQLRALTREAVRLLQPLADEREVDLRLRLDPFLPDSLHGDPVRLRQVLLNLIGNGIRFTRRGTVAVLLAAEAGGLRCEVRDTGPGIRPEDQARLFQPFSPPESTRSRQLGGSGLGLFISRSLVELMGGEIGVESVPGSGSTFWFRIPLVPAREPEAAPSAPEEPDLRPLRRNLRVLVVDDQHVNRAVTRALLEDLGYAADIADCGEEALALNAARPYDAVLLDCQMPGLDGFETCRLLRQGEAAGRRAVVIAVTADLLPEDEEECAAAGMDDHLAKPVWSADLAAVLDRRLGVLARAAEVPSPGSLAEERLAGLRRLGDESLRDEVVRAFLAQGEHDLEVLRGALPACDSRAFSAAAHALSGSSGILGGHALAGIAAELAALARRGDLGACAERLPALERELQAFVKEIS